MEISFIKIEMKTILLSLLLGLLTTVSAQNAGGDREIGLFRSKEDFIRNEISDRRISDSLYYLVEDFSGKLIFTRNGMREEIPFESIFGYYNQGVKYRAFKDSKSILPVSGYFKLEDEDAVIVYSKYGYLKSANTKFYYFSRTIDSAIVRLTVKNLSKEFPASKEFTSALKKSKYELGDRKGEHSIVNNIIRKFNY
jgi:hypothetical protein